MKAKRTWSTPSLSIYGKVEAVTASGGGPPPGKCAGGNDVWTMWGHGQPHCGPALS